MSQVDDLAGIDDSIYDEPVPDWGSLSAESIYVTLNPSTPEDKSKLVSWRKKVVGSNGKPMKQIGSVLNAVLKALIEKKLISSQCKPSAGKTLSERKVQLDSFIAIDTKKDEVALALIREKITKSIISAVNVDGEDIEAEHVDTNLAARFVSLASRSETQPLLAAIFSSAEKEQRRRVTGTKRGLRGEEEDR